MPKKPTERCGLCGARLFADDKRTLVQLDGQLPIVAHRHCAEGPRCPRCGGVAHAVCPRRAA